MVRRVKRHLQKTLPKLHSLDHTLYRGFAHLQKLKTGGSTVSLSDSRVSGLFGVSPCPQGSCIGGPANQLRENLGQRNQLAMGKQLYPLGVWKYALFRVNGEIVVNFDLFGIHAWIIGKIYVYC